MSNKEKRARKNETVTERALKLGLGLFALVAAGHILGGFFHKQG